MAEIQFFIIVYGSAETIDSIELLFPIPVMIVHDLSALNHKISTSSKLTESKPKRYFVLLLESIEDDADDIYAKMEENPQVISIYNIWNEKFIPSFKPTKLYYISKETITLVLTSNIIRVLKTEADKQTKLEQISLAKIYLRKAEKIKEWIMSNLRVGRKIGFTEYIYLFIG
jgi:hypothetical protein